jgi:membrane fusion protein (multidrug efflux system)
MLNRPAMHTFRRYRQPHGIGAILLVALVVGLLPGCLPSSKSPEAAATPPPASPVTVFEVEPRDTPVTIEFLGKTASSRRVEIRSRVEGFLESREYEEGTLVQTGDILFQMDRLPFEAQLQAAQAELAQQQAKLTNAEANLARVRPLANKNAVAKKELDDALGIYRSAAAAVEAAQAKVIQAELDLGYTTIKSPVTGISSFATQREGAYIGFGMQSLLTYVAQIDPIWVEFSVSENQLLKARANDAAGKIRQPPAGHFDVEVVLADGSVYPQTGRITFADASLSETTGTFLLRAELPNPKRGDRNDSQLRPGQFVRVRLKGAIRPNAVLIPQRAVQQGAKGDFVWVIDADDKAEFRPITVGAWHGDDWFIDDGLNDGDRVVVDGALKLRAGAPVRIIKPGEDAKAAPQQAASAES